MKNIRGKRPFRHWSLAVVMAIAVIFIFTAMMPVVMAGKPVKPPSTTTFEITTVDGLAGSWSQIALDDHNFAHITYYDPSTYALKYATNAGGSWSIETIDVIGSRYYGPMGGVADIAVDSAGTPHVLYMAMGQNLVYAQKVDGLWNKQSLDTAVAGQCSIVINSTDTPHICYWENANPVIDSIIYGTITAGSWSLETVAVGPTVSWDVDIALDSRDEVHILYLMLTDYQLRIATKDDSVWTSEILDLGGFIAVHSSIAIDLSDNIHLAYNTHNGHLQQYSLVYANNVGGSWSTLTLTAASEMRSDPSIAVDANGQVHICFSKYSTSTKTTFNYATNAGGSWAIKLVDGSRNVGAQSDLAVDTNFKVQISYSGSPGLKYAKSI